MAFGKRLFGVIRPMHAIPPVLPPLADLSIRAPYLTAGVPQGNSPLGIESLHRTGIFQRVGRCTKTSGAPISAGCIFGTYGFTSPTGVWTSTGLCSPRSSSAARENSPLSPQLEVSGVVAPDLRGIGIQTQGVLKGILSLFEFLLGAESRTEQ